MQGHVEGHIGIELERKHLASLPAALDRLEPSVDRDPMLQMDDEFALDQFGEIQQLIDLRLVDGRALAQKRAPLSFDPENLGFGHDDDGVGGTQAIPGQPAETGPETHPETLVELSFDEPGIDPIGYLLLSQQFPDALKFSLPREHEQHLVSGLLPGCELGEEATAGGLLIHEAFISNTRLVRIGPVEFQGLGVAAVFADRARLVAGGGRGGDGALSFRREKYVPKGGPDGGDGGNGGDVVLIADPDRRDLASFRGKTRFRAARGRHGQGADRRGADGEDTILQVPVGTQVFDIEGGLTADLAHAGARVVVARGGRGGAGNRRFAGPTRQTPRLAEPGLPGEHVGIELRLKLLADAALLGFPNAGKSSLLRRISHAKPKVAEYPFTTVAPVLGTVEAPDGRQLTVADVPGLLEGASRGVGLGHEFLAHLERARLLVHVIDPHEGDPAERFAAIDRELRAYGAGLVERPQIVVLNKADLSGAVDFAVSDGRILAVVRTSAVTGHGIQELRRVLFDLIPALPSSAPSDDAMADFLVYRPRSPRRRAFRVLRTDRGFVVTGRDLESIPDEEIETALREAGARRGAEVTIGERVVELA